MVNGAAELDNKMYTPVLTRVCNHLQQLWQKGWLPWRDHDPDVSWIHRAHNATADYLANIALQDRRSDEWTTDGGIPCNNLVIMSDDGFKDFHGSAACVIFAASKTSLQLVHFSHLYLNEASSAFQCEMIALSEALSKAHE